MIYLSTAARVRDHLVQFGLTCKDPEWQRDGTCVLSLRVMGNYNGVAGVSFQCYLIYSSEHLFSVWEIDGHLSVCGWLRVATTFLRQHANSVTAGWDDEMRDPSLIQMLSDIIAWMAQKDPAQGDCSVDGREVTVWIDASSLVTSVVVESGESLIEDCMLVATSMWRQTHQLGGAQCNV